MNIVKLAEQLAASLPGRLADHSIRVGDALSPVVDGWMPPYFAEMEQTPQGCMHIVAAATGYLHDTVEEGYMTLTGIRAFFGDKVADAVDAVTRYDIAETYEDYIKRAAAHPIGRLVKIADLRDNLKDLPPELESLRARYEAALKELAGN